MHKSIEPSILYFGTPVVVLSTCNEDGSSNIAPMSSFWCLGWSCMLGLDATSQSTKNLRKRTDLVINLASGNNAGHIDKIALTSQRK